MTSNIRIVQSALRACRKNRDVPDKIAKIILPVLFRENWLEDNIKEDLSSEMLKTTENLSSKEEFERVSVELFEGYLKTRMDSFEEQLNKLKSN